MTRHQKWPYQTRENDGNAVRFLDVWLFMYVSMSILLDVWANLLIWGIMIIIDDWYVICSCSAVIWHDANTQNFGLFGTLTLAISNWD